LAINSVDNGHYVISSQGVWRPGRYRCRRAAKYASRFSDESLSYLQRIVNSTQLMEKRAITFEMLQEHRKFLKSIEWTFEKEGQ